MHQRIILYVEDDDSAFFVAKTVLEEMVPQVRLFRASDGEEALAFLRKGAPYEDAPKPDLILLDLHLPKKNGFEVLGELKRSEALRAIPVVIFSTSEFQSDRSASLDLGAQDYVVKPTSFQMFVEALKRACSLSEDSARN